MRLAEKERLFRDLVRTRFESDTLTDDQTLMSALCADLSMNWDPVRADPDGNQEKTEFKFHGEQISAKRRTITSSAGFSTKHIRLFDVKIGGSNRRRLPFAEKRFSRPPEGVRGQRIWLEEALFYLEIQPQLQADGFRIPECLFIFEQQDGSYSLCMERISSFRKVESYSDRLLGARALGRLAGVAAARKAADSFWIRIQNESGDLAVKGTASQRLQRLAPLNVLTPETVAAFDTTHEILSSYYAECETFPHTIRHNDAHGGNVRINPANEICVLDWARVSAGHIGDDLCQMFQPWIYTGANISTLTDIEQKEAAIFEAYAAGVKDVMPEYDERQVRYSYDVRSIIHSLGRLKGKHAAMESFLGRIDSDSGKRLALYYQFISRKILALRSELCA